MTGQINLLKPLQNQKNSGIIKLVKRSDGESSVKHRIKREARRRLKARYCGLM